MTLSFPRAAGRRLPSLTAVALACGLLASCAAANQRTTGEISQASGPRPTDIVYDGPVPTFTGPWASELTQAYRSTDSTLDHTILAKGKIDDQDYAAVSSVFVSCMSTKGYTVELGSTISTFTVESHHKITSANAGAEVDAQGQALKACQAPFEAVASLYVKMLQDPQNVDMNTLIAECLVKSKIAPSTYSAADFKQDSESQQFPFDINSAKATACISSPLGLSITQSQQ